MSARRSRTSGRTRVESAIARMSASSESGQRLTGSDGSRDRQEPSDHERWRCVVGHGRARWGSRSGADAALARPGRRFGGGAPRDPAEAPGERRQEAEREGEHAERRRGGQPAGDALLLLALKELVVVDERAGEGSPRRHPRGRDGGVPRHVDGQAEDLAAALEPDRGLPVAVDGDRLGGAVVAVALCGEPVDDQAAALPGGDVEPGGVLGGLRGIDPDLGADLALGAGPQVASVTWARTFSGRGGPQPVGEHARDREQGDGGDGSRHRRARQAAAQRAAEQRADQAAGDRRRRSPRSAPREGGPRSRGTASRSGTSPIPRRSRPFRSEAGGRAEGQGPAGERERRRARRRRASAR